ncbi:hypothetical protein EVAR_101387_1 [Eumeta japonica]|uniref:Uncharacterized protein n=1 Tax=Eumeta variegata TaxID=151549 RepID=A0A4C1ST66_EUMVA|nr:hypothetical protein EVAR_101387_1 [Eumeta japonica]
MVVGSPRVISKENSTNWVEVPIRLQHSGSSVAVAYQHSVLGILGMVVVKLRHDAHLSASSQLFAMPGLVKAPRAERELARTPMVMSICSLHFADYQLVRP